MTEGKRHGKFAMRAEDASALADIGPTLRRAIDKVLTIQGAESLNDALLVTVLSNALAEACYRGDFPDREGVLDAALDCALMHFRTERAAAEGPAGESVP